MLLVIISLDLVEFVLFCLFIHHHCGE